MKGNRIKKLLNYVLPTTLGSLCFFLFTIVDGIFVGRGVGSNALGSVNLTMPFVIVVNALFQLTTIGGGTIIAIFKGKKDKESANEAFMHSFIYGLIVSLFLSIIGITMTKPLCFLMGTKKEYLLMSSEYLFWYSLFLVPMGLSTNFQGFIRNDNSPILVSVATILGAIVNIFLDWLFIFPLKMGIKGAAIATGMSQILVLILLLLHFVFRKGDLSFFKAKFKFEIFKRISLRGLPEAIAQCSASVTTLWLNKVLIERIGDIGVNAFSIVSYVATFSMGIFFGVSEGLQPLFGYSHGSKNKEDLKFYFISGFFINFFGSSLINILLLFIGNQICRLFGASNELLEYTVQSIPKYSWGFIITGFITVISSYFFSTEKKKKRVPLFSIQQEVL